MAKQFKSTQQQIHEQVDPSRKVGRVKEDNATGFDFRDIKYTGKPAPLNIVWKKRYYTYNRNATNGLVDYDRVAFNAYGQEMYSKSIPTEAGNMHDDNLPAYINVLYAIKVYSQTSKPTGIKIETDGGNATLCFGLDITGTGTASGSVWTVAGDSPGWTNNILANKKFYDNGDNEYTVSSNTANTITVSFGANTTLIDGNFRVRDAAASDEVASTEGTQIFSGGTYYLDLLANTWHTIYLYYYREIEEGYVRITGDLGKQVDAWKEPDFEPPPRPRWNENYVGTLSDTITASSKHVYITASALHSPPDYGTLIVNPFSSTYDCIYYESKATRVFKYVTGIDRTNTGDIWEGSIRSGYYDTERGLSYVRLRWVDPTADDLGGVGVYEVQWLDTELTVYDQPSSTTLRFSGDVRATIKADDTLKIDDTELLISDISYTSPYTTITIPAFSGAITGTVYRKQYIWIADVKKGEQQYDVKPVEAGSIYEYALDAYDTSEFKNRSGKTVGRSIVAGDRTEPDKPTNVEYKVSGGSVVLTWRQITATDLSGYRIWGKGSSASYVKDNTLFSTTKRFTLRSTNGFSTGNPILVQITGATWELTTIAGIYGSDIEALMVSAPMKDGLVYRCSSTTVATVTDSENFTVADGTKLSTSKPLLLNFGGEKEETTEIWSITGNSVQLKDAAKRKPVVGDRLINLELVSTWSGRYASYNVPQQIITTGFGTITKFWVSSFDKANNESLANLNATANIYYGVGTVKDWGNNNLISSFDELDTTTYPYADEIFLYVGQVYSTTDNEVIAPIAVIDLTTYDYYKDSVGGFDVIKVKPLYWGEGYVTGIPGLTTVYFVTSTRHTPDDPTGDTNLTSAVVGARLVDRAGNEARIIGRDGNRVTYTGTLLSGTSDYGILSGAENLGD